MGEVAQDSPFPLRGSMHRGVSAVVGRTWEDEAAIEMRFNAGNHTNVVVIDVATAESLLDRLAYLLVQGRKKDD